QNTPLPNGCSSRDKCSSGFDLVQSPRFSPTSPRSPLVTCESNSCRLSSGRFSTNSTRLSTETSWGSGKFPLIVEPQCRLSEHYYNSCRVERLLCRCTSMQQV